MQTPVAMDHADLEDPVVVDIHEVGHAIALCAIANLLSTTAMALVEADRYRDDDAMEILNQWMSHLDTSIAVFETSFNQYRQPNTPNEVLESETGRISAQKLLKIKSAVGLVRLQSTAKRALKSAPLIIQEKLMDVLFQTQEQSTLRNVQWIDSMATMSLMLTTPAIRYVDMQHSQSGLIEFKLRTTIATPCASRETA